MKNIKEDKKEDILRLQIEIVEVDKYYLKNDVEEKVLIVKN